MADKLLLNVIEKYGDKFDSKGIAISTTCQKLKPKSERFHCLPMLRSMRMRLALPTDVFYTAHSTAAGPGLFLKEFGMEDSIKFETLDNHIKLSLVNGFFEEVQTHVIQVAFGVLNENKQILAPIRTTSKRFGQPAKLKMRPTGNGLEEHILHINALLEANDAGNWDKALGHVILQYLSDIRVRMNQVVTLADSTSKEFIETQTNIDKMGKKIKRILAGKKKNFMELKDQASVHFPVSEHMGSVLNAKFNM